MIWRLLAMIALAWIGGFAWFSVTLPSASTVAHTDGIVVLTGGPGRVRRGLTVLAAGRAKRMLVSGVDPVVRREEFEAVQAVPEHLSDCCIDLGKKAVDTITNATEAATWVRAHHFKSVRLVTSDWHMHRASFEFDRAFHGDADIIVDAVPGKAGFVTLAVEYNKYLARRGTALFVQ
jgi:uncharacterized SAM-binding protein YcdF (DUF218 family)